MNRRMEIKRENKTQEWRFQKKRLENESEFGTIKSSAQNEYLNDGVTRARLESFAFFLSSSPAKMTHGQQYLGFPIPFQMIWFNFSQVTQIQICKGHWRV